MKDSVVLCGNKRPKRLKKLAYIHLQSFDFPLVSPTTGSTLDSIRLEPDRTYTVGRAKGNCDFVFKCRLVSKQHCQILFDCEERKIYIIDGAFLLRSGGGSGREIKSNCVREFRRRFVCNGESGESVECSASSVRVSLNGVFVNGVKVSGMVRELCAGDEVLLGCSNEGACGFQARIGFVVKGVVFKEEVVAGPEEALLGSNRLFESTTSVGHSQGSVSSGKRNKRVFAFPASEDMNPMYDHSRLKCGELFGRAQFLLGQCRDILGSDDPVLHIQQFDASDFRMENPHSFKNKLVYSSHVTTLGDGKCALVDEADPYRGEPVLRDEARACQNLHIDEEMQTDKVVTDSVCVGREHLLQKDNTDNSDNVVADNIHKNLSMNSVCEENASCIGGSEKIKAGKYCCPPPGKKFYLNRLQSMDSRCCHHDVISLPELLHPVENILRIFIATFTTEISWFLSYCEIPSHLPVTIACHSTERCWSSSIDKRTSVPYSNFPNLMLVFPPFPEAIAFGKDRKRQGIACHHPKLLVLQREEHIRVIITSANLVSNQWNNVTNTVWWQDFPRRSAPNFSSLFARLAGGQINKDSKSDFAAQLAGFMSSLMIDVPSQAHWIIELTKYNFEMATGYLIASVPGIHSRVGSSSAEQHKLAFEDVKLLGSVEASVVGLSHLFQNAVDRNGAQLKRLAAFLSKSCKNAYGLLEVVLKRNKNMPVDANAVSILVPNPDQSGDCIQLGFLPRYVAKWVSPLWDSGFFRFSGYIYPKEACAAAIGESNTRVQLILYVSQGPRFSDMIGLMDSEHVVAFCSLIASIKRYSGLWRLQEVLGQYKWPELEESDFFYGASSIGSLVNAQFLASFSAAAGKRSPRLFDSEESDPEWGCWSASQELRNPSIRIIFPTIERVKNSCNGILSSRRILCFSEKTWQRLKTVDILHDAVPYPRERVGHPSHVKVAGRLFRSKTKASSFGWVYCGSHNFSAAAWGRPMSHPFGVNSNQQRMTDSSLGSRLHVCNYELGIVFIFPPAATSGVVNDDNTNIDEIVLPFVVPPPKYEHTDRPATMRAMREALAEFAEQERPELVELATTEEMTEEIPDEEEAVDSADYVVEEQEEEKAYAEMLWVQVDSSES